MIKSNNLEQRKGRPEYKPATFGARKLTLEEHTLKKIANLKENKSILIDCNAL